MVKIFHNADRRDSGGSGRYNKRSIDHSKIANSYNLDVLVFPGKKDDQLSEGCSFLMGVDKAALLTGAADLTCSLVFEKIDDGQPAEDQLSRQ